MFRSAGPGIRVDWLCGKTRYPSSASACPVETSRLAYLPAHTIALMDEPNLSVTIALEAVSLITSVAKPIELRTLAKRVRSKLEKLSVTEVAEFG